jgi:hypothetical protein
MHPIPCFRAPLTSGVGVQGRNYFKNLSTIKIYTYAKFHPDWSDGLDFYKVRIYIFCALYIRFLLVYFLATVGRQNKLECFVFVKLSVKSIGKPLHRVESRSGLHLIGSGLSCKY